MAEEPGVSGWLLMTVGENRQHGGNSGYDDQADIYYTWDSTVPNHAQIKVGDPVALWDKERLLGLSVMEEIEDPHQRKVLFRCPDCAMAGIKARKTKSPRFKCYKCGHLFDQPVTQTSTVVEYRSRHDAAWTSLDDVLSGNELRQLCESPKSQLSMRALRWDAFSGTLQKRGADGAVRRVVQRAPDFLPPGPRAAAGAGSSRTTSVPRAPSRNAGRIMRLHGLSARTGAGGWTPLQLRTTRRTSRTRGAAPATRHPSVV